MGVRPVCQRGEVWEPAFNPIGKAVPGLRHLGNGSDSLWGSLVMCAAWHLCPREARQVAALQAQAS